MSRTSDGLVVGAAPHPASEAFYREVIAGARYVIAADAGLEVCERAGRTPDLCVGDFDSVDPLALGRAESAGVRIVRFPSRKSVSDLDLALDAARSAGIRRLDFTAAFSGRIDHTLAAFGTLLAAADLECRALEPTFTAYAISADARPELTLSAEPPATISVFALDGPATITADGVLYPLSDGRLDALSAYGLSNEAVSSPQHIAITGGRALVMVVDAV